MKLDPVTTKAATAEMDAMACQIVLASPREPVGSVWIRWVFCREKAGTSCCDDPLSTETLWNVSNNAKQCQTPCTASSHADPPNTPPGTSSLYTSVHICLVLRA